MSCGCWGRLPVLRSRLDIIVPIVTGWVGGQVCRRRPGKLWWLMPPSRGWPTLKTATLSNTTSPTLELEAVFVPTPLPILYLAMLSVASLLQRRQENAGQSHTHSQTSLDKAKQDQPGPDKPNTKGKPSRGGHATMANRA